MLATGAALQGATTLLEEDDDGDLRVVEGRVAGEPAVLLVAAVRALLAELGRTGLAGDLHHAGPAPSSPCRRRRPGACASRMIVDVARVDVEVALHVAASWPDDVAGGRRAPP